MKAAITAGVVALIAYALSTALARADCSEVCSVEQKWTGYGWRENERCNLKCDTADSLAARALAQAAALPHPIRIAGQSQ